MLTDIWAPKVCTKYEAGEEPIIEFIADVENSIRQIKTDSDFEDKDEYN